MHYHRFNLTTVPGCEGGGESIMSQHYHQFLFVFEQDKVNSAIISDSEVNLENRERFDPAFRKALRV